MELKDILTCELIKELEKREGVDYITIAPHQIKKFEIEGPAVVLKIID